MDYSQLSPANLFNMGHGSPGGAAGATLPRSSYQSGDRGAVPWSPDSPHFWAAVLIGATLFGVVGASVNFRAGPARAGASLGKV